MVLPLLRDANASLTFVTFSGNAMSQAVLAQVLLNQAKRVGLPAPSVFVFAHIAQYESAIQDKSRVVALYDSAHGKETFSCAEGLVPNTVPLWAQSAKYHVRIPILTRPQEARSWAGHLTSIFVDKFDACVAKYKHPWGTLVSGKKRRVRRNRTRSFSLFVPGPRMHPDIPSGPHTSTEQE